MTSHLQFSDRYNYLNLILSTPLLSSLTLPRPHLVSILLCVYPMVCCAHCGLLTAGSLPWFILKVHHARTHKYVFKTCKLLPSIKMIKVPILVNSVPSHHNWVWFVSANQMQVMFCILFPGCSKSKPGQVWILMSSATNLILAQVLAKTCRNTYGFSSIDSPEVCTLLSSPWTQCYSSQLFYYNQVSTYSARDAKMMQAKAIRWVWVAFSAFPFTR